MSWFTGILLRKEISFQILCKPLLGKGEILFQDKKVILFAGSIPGKNLFFGNIPPHLTWAVSGIGVKTLSDGITFLENPDWLSLITQQQLPEDGHYAMVIIDKEKIIFKTDHLGLRDIYIVEMEDKIIFSTKLEHIALFYDLILDDERIGSLWFAPNRISNHALYKNVTRLVCGKSAEIDLHATKITFQDKDWIPVFIERKEAATEFAERLTQLMDIKNKNVLLGLSGGMDSRLLLSFLLSGTNKNWSAHSSGIGDIDSTLPAQIAEQLNFSHKLINSGFGFETGDIEELQRFSFLTSVNHPVSSYFNLKITRILEKENKVLIDGGFGEIWRREYFNRLIWKGRHGLLNLNSEIISTSINYNRGDIFNDYYTEIFRKNLIAEIDELLLRLPKPGILGVENWVDLFAIKTRLVNYYSPEQSRLDELVINFMPFAQFSLLKKLFEIPVTQRKNANLFRKIIKQNVPELTGFPLVKNGRAYPFGTKTLTARLLTRFFKGKISSASSPILFPAIREYILDMLISDEVKNDNFYDYYKLSALVKKACENQDIKACNSLEWWLSFHMNRIYLQKLTKSRGQI